MRLCTLTLEFSFSVVDSEVYQLYVFYAFCDTDAPNNPASFNVISGLVNGLGGKPANNSNPDKPLILIIC